MISCPFQLYKRNNDKNGISVEVTEGNVQIINSYKIVTPWVRYGYCISLNYFNEDTKDIIKGSSIGMYKDTK